MPFILTAPLQGVEITHADLKGLQMRLEALQARLRRGRNLEAQSRINF